MKKPVIFALFFLIYLGLCFTMAAVFDQASDVTFQQVMTVMGWVTVTGLISGIGTVTIIQRNSVVVSLLGLFTLGPLLGLTAVFMIRPLTNMMSAIEMQAFIINVTALWLYAAIWTMYTDPTRPKSH